MRKLRFNLTLLLLSVLVAVSGYAEAAIINISAKASPTGAAAYSITATDLPESAGIELSITYDDATLEAPQVKSGDLAAGAIMDANVSASRAVRIVFITAGVIKGSGELASVTFTRKGNAPVPQPKLSSSVYAATGTQLAVQSTAGSDSSAAGGSAAITTVAGPTDTTEVTGNSSGNMPTSFVYQSSQTGTQTGSTVVSNLTLPAPGDQGAQLREDGRKDGNREDPANQNVPAASGAADRGNATALVENASVLAVTETKSASTRSLLKSNQSVLDRFRTYKDIRTVKQLSTLFDVSTLHSAGIVQTPAIIVTDGKSLVTVSIDLANLADTPSFSLKGANQKSIRRISDKGWELDALPQKGKSDVRLSIILKGERIEIPLVAVPPLNHTGTALSALSITALDALLAKPLKNNIPVYDLNSDGKQDYLDDYILVAYWLLKRQPVGNKNGIKPAATGK